MNSVPDLRRDTLLRQAQQHADGKEERQGASQEEAEHQLASWHLPAVALGCWLRWDAGCTVSPTMPVLPRPAINLATSGDASSAQQTPTG